MTDVATTDGAMRAAFADGSYWGNTALQGEVRDAIVRGADQVPETSKAVVPASAPSSLRGDSAKYKGELEAMLGDPNSPYWKGTADRSAALFQADYRDLIRAEQIGASVATGPAHETDYDHPADVGKYTLEGIMTAEDRDVADSFLPVAHQLGFGVDRVQEAITWATTTPNPTPAEFKAWAVAKGWSDRAIAGALHWHSKEAARRGD